MKRGGEGGESTRPKEKIIFVVYFYLFRVNIIVVTVFFYYYYYFLDQKKKIIELIRQRIFSCFSVFLDICIRFYQLLTGEG